MSLFQEFAQLLKRNIRDYGMYIALIVIMTFFAISTDGIFINSRNISNLVNQMGYIAVLAVGHRRNQHRGLRIRRSVS